MKRSVDPTPYDIVQNYLALESVAECTFRQMQSLIDKTSATITASRLLLERAKPPRLFDPIHWATTDGEPRALSRQGSALGQASVPSLTTETQIVS